MHRRYRYDPVTDQVVEIVASPKTAAAASAEAGRKSGKRRSKRS